MDGRRHLSPGLPAPAYVAVLLLFYGVAAQAQNLVNNPGFEPDASGWFGRGPVSLEPATPAHTGSNSVRVTERTATWNGIRQPMLGALHPGSTYLCSAWVRTSSPLPETVRLSFQLDYAAAPTAYPQAAAAQVGTEWTYLVGVFTLEPAETLTGLDLFFGGPAGGVDLFVDEVEVRPVGAGAQGNILINPDFEFGLTGWFPRGGEALTSFTPAASGAAAARSTNRTQPWQGLRQSVHGLMALQVSYRCSAWVRTSSPTPETVSMAFELNHAGGTTAYAQVASVSVSNEWTRLSGTFAAEPAGALTGLSLYFNGPAAGIDLMVDNASVERLSFDAPENLLANPGFEPDTDGWSGFGGVTLSNAAGRTGTNAALAPNRTAAYQGPSQSLLGRLLPGEVYVCSAWVKTDSTTSETVRATMRVIQDGTPGYRQIMSGPVIGDGWTWLTGYYAYQPTGDVSDITFYLEGPGVGVSLLVDDVYLAPARGLRLAGANYPQVLMGVGGVNLGDLGSAPGHDTTASAHFRVIGPGNAHKFGPLQPDRGHYTWASADTLLDFSEAHGANARGHVFVWHSQVASWVTGGGFAPSELQTILFDHIATVGARYDHRLFAWDVVNEAISDSGGILRDTLWYNQPGIELAAQGDAYIAESFRRARNADPDALLFYNDYNIETVNTKSTAVYDMLSGFLSDGVPVDGVGLQAHLSGTTFDYASLRENLQRFHALGLDIHITEFDVRLPVDGDGAASLTDLAAQGDVYFHFLGTALAFDGVRTFQIWGVNDGTSWVPDAFPGFGAALAFDDAFDKKPAYWGLYNALANQAEKAMVAVVSADASLAVVTRNEYSAGQAVELTTASPSGSVTAVFDLPYPGLWEVSVGVGRDVDGGRYQLAVAPLGTEDFVDVGGASDTYGPGFDAVSLPLGTHHFSTAGAHAFCFTGNGRDASSVGNHLRLDYVRLTPVDCTPILTAIPDQLIDAGSALPPTRFHAEDDVAAGSLVVTAVSSNPSLMPDESIQIDGSSPDYWISATPSPGKMGVATITLSASDGTRVGNASFTLAVGVQPLSPPVLAISRQGGRVAVHVHGDEGPDYSLEASTGLAGWTEVFSTNAPPMPFTWIDPDGGSTTRRFYRAVVAN